MLTPARALRRGTTTPGFTPGQLFEPDVLLPAQYIAHVTSNLRSPEHRLFLAVLEHAVSGFQKTALDRHGRGQQTHAALVDWFASDDTAWPCAFASICDHLGLDASYLRRGLRQWADRRRAGEPVPTKPWSRNGHDDRVAPDEAATMQAQLRRLRTEFFWTIREIGLAIGLAESTVGELLMDYRVPSRVHAVKIAAALAQAERDGPQVPPVERYVEPTHARCPGDLLTLLDAGWTSTRIAEGLGCSVTRISDWRRGKSQPRQYADALARLAACVRDTAVSEAVA